jgi:hypothetical protein
MSTIRFGIIALVLAVGLSVIGTRVQAHHSHAMFDGTKEITLEGTISGVRFANPHVYLQMKVTKRDDKAIEPAEVWAVEMSTVQNQTQRGLTPNVLPFGASIVIKVNPLFSGEHSGNYTSVVSINGVRNTSTGEDWKPAPRAGL